MLLVGRVGTVLEKACIWCMLRKYLHTNGAGPGGQSEAGENHKEDVDLSSKYSWLLQISFYQLLHNILQ